MVNVVTDDRTAPERAGGLDLLRALAVVVVLLYHGDVLFPGGLLGVSVFFTLSGFLIGGQLWAQVAGGGQIAYGRFWSRRVRRLLPASLLTLLAIVVVWPAFGYHLGDDEIVSALFPLRNWALIGAHSAYGASPSPTVHFWSLAVEEQIYLVLPLLITVGALVARRRPRLVAVLLAVLAAASLSGGALLAVAGRLDRAYFGTDTRAGEVLAGVAAAVWFGTRGARRSRPVVRDAAAVAGLLTIVVVCRIASWPSARLATVAIPLTVAASVTVCVAVRRTAGTPLGALDRLGARRAVRLVADHAYELYLVHVPVYALVSRYRTGLDGGALLAARLLLSAVLAGMLHALVDPLRRRRVLTSGIRFAAAVGVLAVAVVVPVVQTNRQSSALGGGTATDLDRLLAAAPASTGGPPVAATAAPSPSGPPTEDPPQAATNVAPTPPDVPAANTIWLIGDSVLRELDDPSMTAPPLSERLTAAGWTVTGVVGLRGLAMCGEQPSGSQTLPAARDAIGRWYALAPAAKVVIQLGSNDIGRLDLSDDDLRVCAEAMLGALPPDVDVVWMLPSAGPWCWCDLDRARAKQAQFDVVVAGLPATRAHLALVPDALFAPGVDPHAVLLEDGVHGTAAGRDLRADALVVYAGVPPSP